MQSSNGKKILIVDDEPDVTGTFKLGLEESGFKVETFNDPETALSNFKPGKYDLLLLDIKMPKMNGFELYEKIRKIDGDVKTKVCFITAYEVYYQSLREQFPDTKIECYIKKPIQITELSERLHAELAEKQ
jgi:DNA-binding response OmpR family regulator